MKKYIQNKTTRNQKIKLKLINYFTHIVFILTMAAKIVPAWSADQLLILTISRHNLEKIFPTNSLRKCMEISLENLYVDIEA